MFIYNYIVHLCDHLNNYFDSRYLFQMQQTFFWLQLVKEAKWSSSQHPHSFVYERMLYFQKTDICRHSLDQLSTSKIKEVILVGRRGPLQVAFTIKELREIVNMDNLKLAFHLEDFKGIEDILSGKGNNYEIFSKSLCLGS